MNEQDIDAYIAELTAQERAQNELKDNSAVEEMETAGNKDAPENGADAEDGKEAEALLESEESGNASDEMANDISEAETSDDELLELVSKAGADDEDDKDADTTLPKNVQKKINRDNAARKAAEQKAAELQAELDALSARYQPTSGTSPEGTPEQPQTAEERFRAEVRRVIQEEKQQVLLEEKRAKEREEIKQLEGQAQIIEARGKELFDDFDAKVTADKFSPIMMMEIAKISDGTQGAKVAYYLANSPTLAKMIKSMPIIDQIREINAIKARLSVRPQSKVVSTAKKPLSNVGATAGSNLTKETDSKDTDASGIRKLDKSFDELTKKLGIKF